MDIVKQSNNNRQREISGATLGTGTKVLVPTSGKIAQGGKNLPTQNRKRSNPANTDLSLTKETVLSAKILSTLEKLSKNGDA